MYPCGKSMKGKELLSIQYEHSKGKKQMWQVLE
jgi:hypothetical protein